ncbi:MAG: hypothetical protein SGJ09_09485 [Phycisphaerae bacterium]|nr:hypothetical protein [Phycisphaerae bacterium]
MLLVIGACTVRLPSLHHGFQAIDGEYLRALSSPFSVPMAEQAVEGAFA